MFYDEKQQRVNRLISEFRNKNFNHPSLAKACADLGVPLEEITPSSNNASSEKKQHTRLNLLAEYILDKTELETPVKYSLTASKPNVSFNSPNCIPSKQSRVQQNIKIIRHKEIKRTKEIKAQLKIKANKSLEAKKSLVERLRAKGQERDEKTRMILEKRLKDTRDRETLALKTTLETNTSIEKTPNSVPRSAYIHTFDLRENIDDQLKSIEDRQRRGEIYHQEFLDKRAQLNSSQKVSCAQKKREKIDLEDSRKRDWTIKDMLLKTQESRNRREALLYKKIHKSFSTAHDKRKKEERDQKLKEDAIALKDKKINEVREIAKNKQKNRSLEIAEKYCSKRQEASIVLRKNELIENIKKNRILQKHASYQFYD